MRLRRPFEAPGRAPVSQAARHRAHALLPGVRITEGRRLLQHSTLSVLEVAVACGFTSVTHFSKKYSAYFGYRPFKERRLKY